MVARSRVSNTEVIRNVLLAIIAIGSLVVFFGLDFFEGRSPLFFSSHNSPPISFTGDLKSGDIPKDGMERLRTYLGKHRDVFESVKIIASKQDSYAKGPNAHVLFEIHAEMKNGTKVRTPVQRTTMRRFVRDIMAKLDKDAKAARAVGGEKGGSGNTLINSM